MRNLQFFGSHHCSGWQARTALWYQLIGELPTFKEKFEQAVHRQFHSVSQEAVE